MGETLLVKVGRKLIFFLGVVLAILAGFLSVFLLGGFITAISGRTLSPKTTAVGFLIGGLAYAIVFLGFVRARQQKVQGGIMIMIGALLVAPWGILAHEPDIVGWLLSYIGVFLVAGAVAILLGLRAKKL